MTTRFNSNIDDGIVYFNVSLQNAIGASTKPILALINQNMNSPIITNAKNYNLAISRFSVSTSNIPIFIVPVQLGQPNINLTPFSVSLAWNGSTVEQFVEYFTEIGDAVRPAPPITSQDFSTGYYKIYTVTYFLRAINQALAHACLSMFVLQPAFPDPRIPANLPYITYNDSTNLFQLSAPTYFSETTIDAIGVQIFMNNPMYQLLGLNQTSILINPAISGQNHLLTVGDERYGGIPYTIGATNRFLMPADHRAIDKWSPLSRIVVTSTTLQTRGEYLQPGVNYATLGLQSSQAQTNNIITDFEPDYFNNALTNRNFIQYGVTGVANFRLIEFNVIGDSEIRNFNIQFWWMDPYGNTYPLYLQGGCGMNLKLCFIPKNLIIKS